MNDKKWNKNKKYFVSAYERKIHRDAHHKCVITENQKQGKHTFFNKYCTEDTKNDVYAHHYCTGNNQKIFKKYGSDFIINSFCIGYFCIICTCYVCSHSRKRASAGRTVIRVMNYAFFCVFTAFTVCIYRQKVGNYITT